MTAAGYRMLGCAALLLGAMIVLNFLYFVTHP